MQDYFSSFLSVCEFLLACKEKQAREFGIYLYKLMFEEFSDTFARQEVCILFSSPNTLLKTKIKIFPELNA